VFTGGDVFVALALLLGVVGVLVAGAGVIGGLVTRWLCFGCRRRGYTRDLALGISLVLLLLVMPPIWILVWIPCAESTDSVADVVSWLVLPSVCALAAGAAAVWIQRAVAGIRRRRRHARCHSCGYQVHGVAGPRCPECGQPIDLG
jgi:hypothetical protein